MLMESPMDTAAFRFLGRFPWAVPPQFGPQEIAGRLFLKNCLAMRKRLRNSPRTMSTQTRTIEVEIAIERPSADGWKEVNVTVEVYFTPGEPADFYTPGAGDEFEVISVSPGYDLSGDEQESAFEAARQKMESEALSYAGE